MLKLKIDLSDVAKSWRWKKTRWVAGQSWVEPLGHPALECMELTDGVSNFLMVRERLTGKCPGNSPDRLSPAAYHWAVAEALEWPADFLAVQTSATAVRVLAGERGTAPVYLTVSGGALHGSWDLADLRPFLSTEALVEREVARMLTLWRRYSSDTAFAGVYQLTERAMATFRSGELTLTYPEAALHTRPRQLRDDADVIAAYTKTLGAAISSHVYDPSASAVELSGGMDSANVAMSLAAAHQGEVTACAMMIGGDGGRQQLRRRTEMMEGGRFAADVQLEALKLSPLHPSGNRANGYWVSPYEEPFSEATTVLLAQLSSRGIRTVFTGLGGDEMVALNHTERSLPPAMVEQQTLPDWVGSRTRKALADADEGIAPASVITEVTLMAFACRLPLFLRAGLWPVSPLADPALIRFGEWLPRQWRERKHLHRARLQRLGFSHDIAYPPLPENFTLVMETGLRKHGLARLDELRRESLLIDLGYVNGDGLAAACHRASNGGELERGLYEVLATELSLRALSC